MGIRLTPPTSGTATSLERGELQGGEERGVRQLPYPATAAARSDGGGRRTWMDSVGPWMGFGAHLGF